MGKRKYAVLTKAQGKIVTSLIKKGYSQKYAAKKIKIAKKSVSIFVKKKKIGKRAVGLFWGDVKTLSRTEEISYKEARKATFNQPYWARKRAVRQGKEYKSYSEFWKEWREKWRDATEAEREAHGYEATYGNDGSFVGGTVH